MTFFTTTPFRLLTSCSSALISCPCSCILVSATRNRAAAPSASLFVLSY